MQSLGRTIQQANLQGVFIILNFSFPSTNMRTQEQERGYWGFDANVREKTTNMKKFKVCSFSYLVAITSLRQKQLRKQFFFFVVEVNELSLSSASKNSTELETKRTPTKSSTPKRLKKNCWCERGPPADDVRWNQSHEEFQGRAEKKLSEGFCRPVRHSPLFLMRIQQSDQLWNKVSGPSKIFFVIELSYHQKKLSWNQPCTKFFFSSKRVRHDFLVICFYFVSDYHFFLWISVSSFLPPRKPSNSCLLFVQFFIFFYEFTVPLTKMLLSTTACISTIKTDTDCAVFNCAANCSNVSFASTNLYGSPYFSNFHSVSKE